MSNVVDTFTPRTTPNDVARARTLGHVLGEANPFRARILANPDTVITRVPTPFFRQAELYHAYVSYQGLPFGFTLGHAEDWATLCLDANPDGWLQLAETGVDLSTPELRIGYAVTFLEVTRAFSTRFQMVFDPKTIGHLEGLSPTHAAELEQARARVIAPVVSITEHEPWIVRVYAVQGYSLLRIHLKFGSSGIIERTDELLQENVPLPLVI